MKDEKIIFILIIIGIFLGSLIADWNNNQWCRIEECAENTKWMCNRTNNFTHIHWIPITILMVFGLWKLKEVIY